MVRSHKPVNRGEADAAGGHAPAIRCYSQRLLNPFRGVVNIIRYKSAEAVTSDGVHWDIYVSNDSLLEGLDGGRSIQISDIRYGRWSRRDGLTRGAIYPSEEFYMLEDMGAVVYEYLLQAHERVPFPLEDTIELWLLDRDSNPLALLNAVVDINDIDDYQLLDWRAGQLCRQTFRLNDPPEEFDGSDKCAADQLVRMINDRADKPPAAQWFERKQGGAAIALHGYNIEASLPGRQLEANAFPQYFISSSHENARFARLLQDFIEWQSPWLLLLDTLSLEERRYFEQCARKRALAVDRQFLLYPDIIDESFIRAARVEARMRKAQQQKVDQEEVMSTFYIELNPSPTE